MSVNRRVATLVTCTPTFGAWGRLRWRTLPRAAGRCQCDYSPGGRNHIARAASCRVEFEITAAVVPIRQHEALAFAAVHDKMMPRGTMRMSVDHPGDIRVPKRGLDRLGRDIHDRLRLP